MRQYSLVLVLVLVFFSSGAHSLPGEPKEIEYSVFETEKSRVVRKTTETDVLLLDDIDRYCVLSLSVRFMDGDYLGKRLTISIREEYVLINGSLRPTSKESLAVVYGVVVSAQGGTLTVSAEGKPQSGGGDGPSPAQRGDYRELVTQVASLLFTRDGLHRDEKRYVFSGLRCERDFSSGAEVYRSLDLGCVVRGEAWSDSSSEAGDTQRRMVFRIGSTELRRLKHEFLEAKKANP